jgi:hypothetical protein
LELGDLKEGMIHILEEHIDDFDEFGYKDTAEITKLILNNIKNNIYIRDPKKGFSYVYRFIDKNGETQYLRIYKYKQGFIKTAFILNREPEIDYMKNLFQEYGL